MTPVTEAEVLAALACVQGLPDGFLDFVTELPNTRLPPEPTT